MAGWTVMAVLKKPHCNWSNRGSYSLGLEARSTLLFRAGSDVYRIIPRLLVLCLCGRLKFQPPVDQLPIVFTLKYTVRFVPWPRSCQEPGRPPPANTEHPGCVTVPVQITPSLVLCTFLPVSSSGFDTTSVLEGCGTLPQTRYEGVGFGFLKAESAGTHRQSRCYWIRLGRLQQWIRISYDNQRCRRNWFRGAVCVDGKEMMQCGSHLSQ